MKGIQQVIGINRDKTFMPTVANLDWVDIAKIKLSQKECLCLVVCRHDWTSVFALDYTAMNNQL